MWRLLFYVQNWALENSTARTGELIQKAAANRLSDVHRTGVATQAVERGSEMSAVKWIELKCDICEGTHSSLRWLDDINTSQLRQEAKSGGWIVKRTDSGIIDVCNLCKGDSNAK